MTPKLMVQLEAQPAPDFFYNGFPYDLGNYELVPDEKVRYLHKRVNAVGRWSRGRVIVTGVVRGAVYEGKGFTYLVECEETRRLVKTGKPQVIVEGA